MTAAELRTRGDATADQRSDLRKLIEQKAVTDEWVQRLYQRVEAAGGLSKETAAGALTYLNGLADKSDQPTYATDDQAAKLRELIRTRIVPAYLAKLWRTRLDARQMTFIEADRTIREYERLPLRTFPVPDGPRQGTPGLNAPDGYFALTGTDSIVRCYRVHTRPGGQRIVDQFTGPKTSDRRRLPAWKATEVLRAVGGDPDTSGRLFAATRRHCCDCNQPLRKEDPRGPQRGPDCWDKIEAATAAAGEDTR